MNKIKIIVGFLLISITSMNAQTNTFEVELDPLAYAFGGISGHVAYTIKNQRFQIGYAQLTVPEFSQRHDGVTERFNALPSFKWDYFFAMEDASHGFFAGLTSDYMFWEYKSEMDKYKDSHLNIGIRGGYKFDLFKKSKTLKGLYLTPWIGFSYATNTEDYELDNVQYTRSAVSVFPTIHLGWTF